jgi:hypothetical protein
MKIHLKTFFLIVLATINISCDKTDLVGLDDVDVINNVNISITELTANIASLIAKGVITNNGNNNITPPWYIEGDFYSNDTYTFKLGGENTRINFALGPDESTGWELTFISSQYNESDYPDFAVKNLRAYKNPE